MEAQEKKIIDILTENKCYEIPKYQRPYSWTEEETLELLEDIESAYNNSENEYFIGSIITIEKQKDRLYEIVDGQQRLTTLNIIFAKLKTLVNNEGIKEDLQKRILPINVYTGNCEIPRLSVRREDRTFFKEYILSGVNIPDDLELSDSQILMKNNFEKIEEFLSNKSEDELKSFTYYILTNVYVVLVITSNFSSAYRLFNVLNDRGMSLSSSDLLKTKLFEIGNNNNEDIDIIDENWLEMEDLIGLKGKKMDIFLGHCRTALLAKKQQNTLFEEYENEILKTKNSATAFAKLLVKFSKNYNKIMNVTTDVEKEKRLLKSLHNVVHDEWMPPLLAYLNSPVKDMSFFEFLELIEKITIQNWVRRLGKTQRNTVYYNVIRLINDKKSGTEIVEKIKSFSNLKEFTTSLNGDIYGTPYIKAILLRIEEEYQDDSVSKSFNKTISIEHILPQKIDDNDTYWNERFSSELHKEWVHKLGNLTLLSGNKNSSAHNAPFPEKKKIYLKKAKKVSFDLTKEVCENEEWTVNEIKIRHEKLVNIALNLWKIS